MQISDGATCFVHLLYGSGIVNSLLRRASEQMWVWIDLAKCVWILKCLISGFRQGSSIFLPLSFLCKTGIMFASCITVGVLRLDCLQSSFKVYKCKMLFLFSLWKAIGIVCIASHSRQSGYLQWRIFLHLCTETKKRSLKTVAIHH